MELISIQCFKLCLFKISRSVETRVYPFIIANHIGGADGLQSAPTSASIKQELLLLYAMYPGARDRLTIFVARNAKGKNFSAVLAQISPQKLRSTCHHSKSPHNLSRNASRASQNCIPNSPKLFEKALFFNPSRFEYFFRQSKFGEIESVQFLRPSLLDVAFVPRKFGRQRSKNIFEKKRRICINYLMIGLAVKGKYSIKRNTYGVIDRFQKLNPRFFIFLYFSFCWSFRVCEQHCENNKFIFLLYSYISLPLLLPITLDNQEICLVNLR